MVRSRRAKVRRHFEYATFREIDLLRHAVHVEEIVDEWVRLSDGAVFRDHDAEGGEIELLSQ